MSQARRLVVRPSGETTGVNMKKLNAAEWQTDKKELSYDLYEKSWVDAQVNSEGMVKVYVVTADGVEHLVAANNGNLKFSSSIAGSVKLTFKGDRSISARCQIVPEQIDEPRHDMPPFIPDTSNNPLKQIRDRVRREMGVMREAFELLSDTGYPGYELEDEVPDEFEEHFAKRPAPTQARKEPQTAPTEAKVETEATGAENE